MFVYLRQNGKIVPCRNTTRTNGRQPQKPMEPKSARLKIAVFMEANYITNRELLKGFLKFVRLHDFLTPVLRTGRNDEPSRKEVNLDECAAVITDRLDGSILDSARKNRFPVITILGKERTPKVMLNVTCDNASVARFAAGHLLGKGLGSFAFAGGTLPWCSSRADAFLRCIRQRNLPCAVYGHRVPLADFLSSLPRPTGLFAANDVFARSVLAAAKSAGLSVPGDIAIIGVDDDEIICESCDPGLTSIRWNTEETGYMMGEALYSALADGMPPFREMCYSAMAVTPRASTAVRPETDGVVRGCLDLMEINDPKLLSVDILAKNLCVSRRTLERRFKASCGRTLGRTLADLKIERAIRFLQTTRLPQDRIAAECGFSDASHLNAAFKRMRSRLPSSYRKN